MARGLILNFHRESNAAYFEEQILAIKKKYRFVSLAELYTLIQQKKSLENICHITVDDGELSFYEVMYPVLKKHGAFSSLYVSPEVIRTRKNFWFQEIETFNDGHFRQFIAKYIKLPLSSMEGITTLAVLKCFAIRDVLAIITAYQQENKLLPAAPFNMDINQLKEVEASGLVTIGAHTINHPILYNEDDETSKLEIEESVSQLAALLGHKVEYFAYPNGVEGFDFTDREVDNLKKAGILMAVTTTSGHIIQSESVYKIRRLYYPDMARFKRDHPLVLFRLSMGTRWPRLRKRVKDETEMRTAFKQILRADKQSIQA